MSFVRNLQLSVGKLQLSLPPTFLTQDVVYLASFQALSKPAKNAV